MTKDTRPEIAERARANLMARTPEERMAMASRMSVAARRVVEDGVRAALGPGATEAAVYREVLLRFYGRELGRERCIAISDAIEARRLARATT